MPPSVILVLLIALMTCTTPGASAQDVTASGPSSPLRDSSIYTCSMHPGVRAAGPGNCTKCGMPLVTLAALRERIDYVLEVENTPAAAKSGEKLRLRFLLFHPKTGAQVKEFNVFHTMPFHLFIVSHDLKHYSHIHPIQQPDGSFTIDTVLPEPGQYEIFCDLFPVGAAPQVLHRSLATADSPSANSVQTKLEADKSLTKTVGGIRFELTLQPPQPVAGQPTLLSYNLVDAKTGLPVTDLQPYLGAWGHAVALRDDATDFLHSHATRSVPTGTDRSRRPFSDPRIDFSAVFARPGQHRIWSQVQRNDKVVTVSFTLSVSRLDRLAKWDGTDWSSLAGGETSGLDGTARALAANGNDVYLGGDFTQVGGVRASRVAKWDGHRWSALGGGVNGTVWAIAVSGRDVYVGGEFTEAGGKSAPGIARWDGRQWSALGQGISGCRDVFTAPTVYALAVRGAQVYAGGRFVKAGGAAANGIALWDGQTWAALGEGVRTGIYDGVIRALALRGDDLYAGGQFATAGDAVVYNIARWNGRRWSALGSGIRGNLEEVLAIGVSGSDVYVGGMFGSAGPVRAPNLAKWNGNNWSAADVQPNDGVWTIAVSGRSVYAGGASFNLPDGAVAQGIVQWYGGKWSALGSGLGTSMHPGPIMVITPSGDGVYVGGDAFRLPDAPDLTPRRAARDAR
jgi:heavy metal-binding protein